MKLTAKQIPEFLAAPTHTAGVLIYGADYGLVSKRAKDITSKVLIHGDDGFNRSELSEDQCLSDSARLADELNAMSLMGGRRLIWVRDASDKLASVIKSALEQASASVPTHEQHFLLVTAHELGARSTLRSLFEQSKVLTALPCYKEEAQGMAQLVRSKFAAAALRFPSEAVPFLVSQLLGDRMIAESELDKILLYYGEGGQVDMESLRQLTSGSLEIELDALCHAFAAGQLASLMRHLDAALLSTVQPIIILRSVSALLTRIEQIQSAAVQAGSMDRAIEAMRPPIFYKEKPLFLAHVRRWNGTELRFAKHQLMQLEVKVKLQHEIDALLLKDGLLRLCAKPLKAAA